ncbi:hypothetical protein OOU_Y34scaffold00526g5 [Pyricularia oryzae Y34]|uniref:Uncharacterized protein n=2 Tax=Pyricularia oryzae TaxID=318829 RepID=A0AA97PL94_PYRO3|nr:hypothetical protein OOU_Y34scaffold00526g5 [Pyricularia oryzae Y34]
MLVVSHKTPAFRLQIACRGLLSRACERCSKQ